jgi:hypothetical protein
LIQNLQSGNVLEVQGNTVAAFREVGHASSQRVQQWCYDSSRRALVHMATGKVLDISGGLGGRAQRQDMLVHGAHGGRNQQWVYDLAMQAIKCPGNDKVLDIEEAGGNTTRVVACYGAHGGPSQRWQLVPVGALGGAAESA